MQEYAYEFIAAAIALGTVYTFIGCYRLSGALAYTARGIGFGLFMAAAHKSGNDSAYPVLIVAWLCVYKASAVISACLEPPSPEETLHAADAADSPPSA